MLGWKKSAGMMRFIQLQYRSQNPVHARRGLGPLVVAIILGLFLLVQIGLVVWVYLNQW